MFTGKRVLYILLVAVSAAALWAGRIPLAQGQTPQPVKVELTPYESNPILTAGTEGEWDSGFVFGASVIVRDSTYYMFYTGGASFMKDHAVGYATSEDGLHWTKYANNPILKRDPAIYKGYILFAIPVVDGDTWILYFPDLTALSGAQKGVRRATAPAPEGPWTIDDQPVLTVGGNKEWDKLKVELVTVFRDPDQFVLYYHTTGGAKTGIGMATSPDGVTWAKYNDPATVDAPYAESDPVFLPGEHGQWDDDDVLPTVLHTAHGWEMFYLGSSDFGNTWDLGYATSLDGITWTRFGDGPIMARPDGYTFWLEGIRMVDDQYYVYHDMFLPDSISVGVSTATVTWE
jgi:hypothetical protein